MSWPCVCLPGCERLEPVGENTYRAVLNMTIAAISGNYEGTAAIVDQPPPRAYKIPIDGQGRSGFVKGEAGVALTEESGNTVVIVRGTAEVWRSPCLGGSAAAGQRFKDDCGPLLRLSVRLEK